MGQPLVTVYLVRHQEHPIRGSLLSQNCRHCLVKSGNPRLRIDHEEYECSLFAGDLDLIFDLGRELSQVSANFVVAFPFDDINAITAGVDQLDKLLRRPFGGLQRGLDLDDAGYPIPGHARRGIDDRHPLSGQSIEQARLADVGATHNCDLGKGHRGDCTPSPLSNRPEKLP